MVAPRQARDESRRADKRPEPADSWAHWSGRSCRGFFAEEGVLITKFRPKHLDHGNLEGSQTSFHGGTRLKRTHRVISQIRRSGPDTHQGSGAQIASSTTRHFIGSLFSRERLIVIDASDGGQALVRRG